jgi:class 3 adenylate cyclase
MTDEPSENQREEDRARVARLLEPHAPQDWETRFRRDELLDAVVDGEPIQMFVMAADIRESTNLMKEAIRFEKFAQVMDRFVSSVRNGITRSGGWFDKFTGDGFLAYWIVQQADPAEYEERFVQTAGDLAHTANVLVDLFHRRVMEDFRSNSRNLSAGVGLSMGLDAGPGYLVKIADELTIVGPPVVGAVRMVTAAQPKEVVANVFLGEHLRDGQEGAYEALGVTVTRELRPSKEYPNGQEVYALSFAAGEPDDAEEPAEEP